MKKPTKSRDLHKKSMATSHADRFPRTAPTAAISAETEKAGVAIKVNPIDSTHPLSHKKQ